MQRTIFLGDDPDMDSLFIDDWDSPDLMVLHQVQTGLNWIIGPAGHRLWMKTLRDMHFGRACVRGDHVEAEVTVHHHTQQTMPLRIDDRHDADIFFGSHQRGRETGRATCRTCSGESRRPTGCGGATLTPGGPRGLARRSTLKRRVSPLLRSTG